MNHKNDLISNNIPSSIKYKRNDEFNRKESLPSNDTYLYNNRNETIPYRTTSTNNINNNTNQYYYDNKKDIYDQQDINEYNDKYRHPLIRPKYILRSSPFHPNNMKNPITNKLNYNLRFNNNINNQNKNTIRYKNENNLNNNHSNEIYYNLNHCRNDNPPPTCNSTFMDEKNKLKIRQKSPNNNYEKRHKISKEQYSKHSNNIINKDQLSKENSKNKLKTINNNKISSWETDCPINTFRKFIFELFTDSYTIILSTIKEIEDVELDSKDNEKDILISDVVQGKAFIKTINVPREVNKYEVDLILIKNCLFAKGSSNNFTELMKELMQKIYDDVKKLKETFAFLFDRYINRKKITKNSLQATNEAVSQSKKKGIEIRENLKFYSYTCDICILNRIIITRSSYKAKSAARAAMEDLDIFLKSIEKKNASHSDTSSNSSQTDSGTESSDFGSESDDDI